jgi:dTDP-4-amino-4,6-dideoxygalactose transaminase
LYATKNVTTGEGGVVTTNDDALADRLRLLRNQGMRERYRYELPGHNWRMTDVQAAIGLPQLARLGTATEMRRQNAARITAGLADVPGLLTPATASGRTHVFHQYTLRVLPEAGIDRAQLSERLAALGVGTGIYYPKLVHDYECYQGNPAVGDDSTPEAARAADEVLSLPVHPLLRSEEVETVIDSTREALA